MSAHINGSTFFASGGSWNDFFGCDEASCNFFGGLGDDFMAADSVDILETVGPHENSSRLYGGAHNDQLRGDGGDDELHGGTGADILEGGGDDDLLDDGIADNASCGSGTDTAAVDAGLDVVNADCEGTT
jgi:Ca2+-binding RTX toxin-like protein